MNKIIGIILTILGTGITILNLIMRIKGQMTFSIIGGSDGPTSIFVAGKVGGVSNIIGIIVGIVLIVIGIFILAKKK